MEEGFVGMGLGFQSLPARKPFLEEVLLGVRYHHKQGRRPGFVSVSCCSRCGSAFRPDSRPLAHVWSPAWPGALTCGHREQPLQPES